MYAVIFNVVFVATCIVWRIKMAYACTLCRIKQSDSFGNAYSIIVVRSGVGNGNVLSKL